MRFKPSFLFVGEFHLLESNVDRHQLGLGEIARYYTLGHGVTMEKGNQK